jgi:hypothetical protein
MDAVQRKADTTTTLVAAREERGEERREKRERRKRERRERDRCSDAMKSIFHPSYPLPIRPLSTHVNIISSMGSFLIDFFILAKKI